MPLVFVHGVATRESPTYAAERAQRTALFQTLVFNNPAALVRNPDWGDRVPVFSRGQVWIPNPDNSTPFAAGAADFRADPPPELGLSDIAKIDGAQAVDLVIGAALNKALAQDPATVATDSSLELAQLASNYLIAAGAVAGGPKGLGELAAATDAQFGQALAAALELQARGTESFGVGVGQMVKDALGAFGGWIGNEVSDAALRAKRKDLSQSVALFLGDIFVYLRERDVPGPTGTEALLFTPIVDDLIAAAKVRRAPAEPLVVVGHSLGGVLLYDILTDPHCLARLAAEAGEGFRIDLLLTAGSQPGFFKDLGLYLGKPAGAGSRLAKPASVEHWLNVCDFTDVFSFLCAPFFNDVEDFSYDTVVDLFNAHSAYFKRPSFYARLQLRLKGLGYL